MTRTLTLILLLAGSTSLFAQKFKFKDREILLDKEVIYRIGIDEERQDDHTAFTWSVISTAGDTLLAAVPRQLLVTQLPYEEQRRKGKWIQTMTMHETGTTYRIPHFGYGLGKAIYKQLTKNEMLTADGVDYTNENAFFEWFRSAEKMIEKHEEVNEKRAQHYAATVEKYGADSYVTRAEGDITITSPGTLVKAPDRPFEYYAAGAGAVIEGKTRIGSWEKMARRTPDGYDVYAIRNIKGDNVAKLRIKASRIDLYVTTIADGEEHDHSQVLMPPAKSTATNESLVIKAAGELVAAGYL